MVTDGDGRPVVMMLSEGQMSDHKGAKMLLDHLPHSDILLADRGYDCDRFRAALQAKAIEPCIPPRRNRKSPSPYHQNRYKRRYKVECAFSANSKTGGALQHDTTDVHIPSSVRYSSLLS